MSTEQTWQTESTSLKATLELAAQIGRKLKGGEIIVLSGDLGAGKTAFTRGLASGMGSTDTVHSPSYTLSNQYRVRDLTMYHFDFYRLDEPGIMRQELAEVVTDPRAVIVVEWAGIIDDILPAKRITIQLQTSGETSRTIKLSCPDSQEYLIPSNS